MTLQSDKQEVELILLKAKIRNYVDGCEHFPRDRRYVCFFLEFSKSGGFNCFTKLNLSTWEAPFARVRFVSTLNKQDVILSENDGDYSRNRMSSHHAAALELR